MGYMQPIGSDPEMNTFLLIEYPVGCWYCETPEITAMVLKGPTESFFTRSVELAKSSRREG